MPNFEKMPNQTNNQEDEEKKEGEEKREVRSGLYVDNPDGTVSYYSSLGEYRKEREDDLYNRN
ncbi:hypothetical protein GX917_02145 [Candidatus Falkowbacteria bacterium]|jgi:hypothetical protein|nr:hypothetical protein [Candidatus Falkowbacteria bacterium]